MVINFNPSTLAPYFFQRQYTFTINVGAPKMLLPLNSARVLAVIQCAGANMVIMPYLAPVSPFGMTIQASTPPFLIEFAKWGGVVGMEWYGTALAGTVSASALEVWFSPPGGA